MNVFLLERTFWEEIHTIGVFSTYEKAKEVEENHKYFGKHRFYISELEIDEVIGE